MLAAAGGAATLMTPIAGADPTLGHGIRVRILAPPLLCEIGSDDTDPGIGPNVVCQGSFPQAPVVPCPACPEPMHQDQAIVSAAGVFSYRDANIGVGDHPNLDIVAPGQTYRAQGWIVTASDTAVTFTHEQTGHGMRITAGGDVGPF
jgi:hypothetical protein